MVSFDRKPSYGQGSSMGRQASVYLAGRLGTQKAYRGLDRQTSWLGTYLRSQGEGHGSLGITQ